MLESENGSSNTDQTDIQIPENTNFRCGVLPTCRAVPREEDSCRRAAVSEISRRDCRCRCDCRCRAAAAVRGDRRRAAVLPLSETCSRVTLLS
ncbi:hypothetical protein Pint_05879 [Pistacia integerrima]|uniref:Uncharacterized protein n=1 Tax=Pistacia integerrima TaxID=434235 RepID=A0ACC0Z5H3_9ROSI|nr:hypothetical protein Pint_05879 [Pistacia integerrima]